MAETEMGTAFEGRFPEGLHGFAGFDRVRALEEAYLPQKAAQRYAGTLGHMPSSGRD
ncbi:MAG: hypothetical protein ICV73_30500 [Acetobacteraceae bacterium]|nr:hypothetical protein [Acetobacteraceae bacterium]